MDKYIPAVAEMDTTLKKYNVTFTQTVSENKKLQKKNADLQKEVDSAGKTSVVKKLEQAQLQRDYEAAMAVLERIPKEVIDAYTRGLSHTPKNKQNER